MLTLRGERSIMSAVGKSERKRYKCGDFVIFNHPYHSNISGVVVECLNPSGYLIHNKKYEKTYKVNELQVVYLIRGG